MTPIKSLVNVLMVGDFFFSKNGGWLGWVWNFTCRGENILHTLRWSHQKNLHQLKWKCNNREANFFILPENSVKYSSIVKTSPSCLPLSFLHAKDNYNTMRNTSFTSLLRICTMLKGINIMHANDRTTVKSRKIIRIERK